MSHLTAAGDASHSPAVGTAATAAVPPDTRGLTPDRTCGIKWGICPEHGNTLISSGRVTSCQRGHDVEPWRFEAACPEAVIWQVEHPSAEAPLLMCDQHGRDAHRRLLGAVVKPIGR